MDSISRLNRDERRVYEQLRLWRNSQARREKIRPYIIAHNTALMAIVYYKVSNIEELMRIYGFSERKANKYGNEIIEIMNQYKMATGIIDHTLHINNNIPVPMLITPQ
ncbi:MAG: HRDC domain-containing protein [Candidatus Lokiarchaeota archaeon]|nr:HRDC domain-containing protein [Candidatus Lokiarchaeota archaeon]